MLTGFVTVTGRPNVGKSTLINALVGGKVAIVSARPQTTRNRIMGIVNSPDYQIVLVDTPGIQKPRNKLGEFMESAVSASYVDADVVLVVLDASAGIGSFDQEIIERVQSLNLPLLVVLNKSDLVDSDKLQMLKQQLEQKAIASLPISAKTGQGLKELIDAILGYLKPGPLYFPPDAVTDMPEAFLCAELVREKALELLSEEVPHGIGVAVERFFERDDGVVEVHCVMYCERESHKGIIIGKNGSMLKKIGTLARKDMEHFFDARVFLKIFVKVRKDWRNKPSVLKELGYK